MAPFSFIGAEHPLAPALERFRAATLDYRAKRDRAAWLEFPEDPALDDLGGDVLRYMPLRAGRHVAVVGHFRSLRMLAGQLDGLAFEEIVARKHYAPRNGVATSRFGAGTR